MLDTIALAKHYETLTNAELLNVKHEGGFTEEAEQVLAAELRRRKLDASDLSRYEAQSDRTNLREETAEKGSRGWGPGLLFFGKRYLNEEDRRADIQVSTKWFALGGVPLVPIASYRFRCSGSAGRSSANIRSRVVSRVPLNWTQVFLTWLKTAILVLAILLAAGVIWYRNHGSW